MNPITTMRLRFIIKNAETRNDECQHRTKKFIVCELSVDLSD